MITKELIKTKLDYIKNLEISDPDEYSDKMADMIFEIFQELVITIPIGNVVIGATGGVNNPVPMILSTNVEQI